MKSISTCKWLPVLLFVFFTACNNHDEKKSGDVTETPPKTPCNLDAPVIFSSNVPHEVDVSLPNGYQGLSPTTQPCFDIFSWQSFIALNWPANPDGSPSQGSITSNISSPRVWEYYKQPSEVFNTNEHLLPFSGMYRAEPGLKGFYTFTKLTNELASVSNLPASIKQATGQPLIDKNLNFALFEVHLNKDEVDYLVNDSLTTIEGQKGKTIKFPSGSVKGPVGAIEIKASWKILEPGKDDTSKFYKRMAVIYIPATESANGKALYLKELVGLVGMHILHKTELFPFWVWTTFEHIDDAPQQAVAKSAGNNFSFFNPACTGCAYNTPPTASAGNKYLWQPNKPYAKLYATNSLYGTQAVSVDTVYGPTDAVNRKWQKALADAGSVFANYRLIGSQWSVVLDAPPFDTVPAPTNLTNITLETFIQPSSCTMTCHKFAKDAVGKPSDFSFIPGHARAAALVRSMKKSK
ncbi:MAG: hypothetical protein JNM14_14045 [Ferruginibacter sp.]|nr:hypothetical protein [Ferruginibacter sp.]